MSSLRNFKKEVAKKSKKQIIYDMVSGALEIFDFLGDPI